LGVQFVVIESDDDTDYPPAKQTSSRGSKLNVQGDIPKSSDTKEGRIVTSKVKSERQGSVPPAPTAEISVQDVKNLPVFTRAAWATRFLPTLYHCLGAADKPWVLADGEDGMVQTIQEVLDYAYPSSGYKVKHGDKIFTMVSRSLTVKLHT
jgi:hypothetical protein